MLWLIKNNMHLKDSQEHITQALTFCDITKRCRQTIQVEFLALDSFFLSSNLPFWEQINRFKNVCNLCLLLCTAHIFL